MLLVKGNGPIDRRQSRAVRLVSMYLRCYLVCHVSNHCVEVRDNDFLPSQCRWNIRLTEIATVRRVKCDEGRPSCQRCISTGRKCDGYEKKSSDSPASSDSSSHDNETSTVLTQSPSSSVILTSDRERHAFHFFINMTAPMMGGFGKESCWSEMIPRAAHHEPSIRHAVVALGALHHSRERSSRSTSPNNLLSSAEEQFPLLEYNRAIKCLVEPFSKKERQAMDVCLINCVLFSAFEVSAFLSEADVSTLISMHCR